MILLKYTTRISRDYSSSYVGGCYCNASGNSQEYRLWHQGTMALQGIPTPGPRSVATERGPGLEKMLLAGISVLV